MPTQHQGSLASVFARFFACTVMLSGSTAMFRDLFQGDELAFPALTNVIYCGLIVALVYGIYFWLGFVPRHFDLLLAIVFFSLLSILYVVHLG